MTTPYQQKKRLNPLLVQVLVISVVLHVAFLLGFGGYTVYKHVQRADTQFEQAPPTVTEAPPPPPQDVEVMIQRQQPQVQQTAMRELRVQQVGNIAVAAVTANVPNMQESFSVSSGTGLAGGMGDGLSRMNIGDATGSLGLGMSELNVFGVTDKGERILFLIDAGRNMLTDDKGGLHSYNAIKEELVRLLSGLAPGTLYNVMLYEFNTRTGARVEAFQPSLVSATPANLERLRQWLMPVNRETSRLGIRSENIKATQYVDTEIGKILSGNAGRINRADPNSHYVVTQIALEQNVDLVYVISSEWRGLSDVARPDNDREAAEWERRVNSQPYQRQLAEHMKEREEMTKIVAEREKAENEERRKRGQPPIVFRHGWLDEKMRHFNLSFKTQHPGHHSPQQYIQARQVQNYFNNMIKENYRDKNLSVPRFNFIMFVAENGSLTQAQRNNLRDYTRFFGGGRFNELKGLPAIRLHTATPGSTRN